MPNKPPAKKSPAKPDAAAKPAEKLEEIAATPPVEEVVQPEPAPEAPGEEALPNAEAEDAPKAEDAPEGEPIDNIGEEEVVRDTPEGFQSGEAEPEAEPEPEADAPVLVFNDAWVEVQPTTPGFRKFEDPAGWWTAEVREDGFARVTKLGTIDRFNRHGGIKRMDTDVTIEGDVLSIIERLAALLVLTDAGD